MYPIYLYQILKITQLFKVTLVSKIKQKHGTQNAHHAPVSCR